MPRADRGGLSRPASPGPDPEPESDEQAETEKAVETETEPGREPEAGGSTKPWLSQTGRWVLVALAYSIVSCGIWAALFQLYFRGFHEAQQTLRCDAQLEIGWTASGQDVEDFVGAVPIWLRGILMGALGVTVCRRISGFSSDEPHIAQALLIGRGSTLGRAREAGWDAVVGSRSGSASGATQSSWEQAREARRLTMRQAISSSVTKVLFWHASQPVVYLYMLDVYSCHVSSLGGWQRELAATVAVREALYLASICLALWDCPVFLLMDPVTAWNEAGTRVEKVIRVAMYVLTPHNYVAFCLANRFRGWRRTFLGLAAIQIIADLASCFALGTLIAGGISSQKNTPTALIISYTITAFGFLLFFGPLSAGTSLRAAADTTKSRAVRVASGLAGSALLCLLGYIMLLFVLLISGKVNPYCDGFTFQSDPCNGRGVCYAAGQCHCELGWGPEVSYTGEALCVKPNMPCTADQLRRAADAPKGGVCCAHRGKTVAGGCECDVGFGPELPDDPLVPLLRMCGTKTGMGRCTSGQIERAFAANSTQADSECCSGHGKCRVSDSGKGFCKCDSKYGPELLSHIRPEYGLCGCKDYSDNGSGRSRCCSEPLCGYNVFPHCGLNQCAEPVAGAPPEHWPCNYRCNTCC